MSFYVFIRILPVLFVSFHLFKSPPFLFLFVLISFHFSHFCFMTLPLLSISVLVGMKSTIPKVVTGFLLLMFCSLTPTKNHPSRFGMP